VHLDLRRSCGAKITAIGFILFILFGNFYLIYQITASSPAGWIQTGFSLSLVLVAIGGIALGIRALFLPRIATFESEANKDDGNSSL
jgi:hypothetical protein